MDETLSPTDGGVQYTKPTHRAVATINSQYAAWLEDGLVYYQKLTSQNEKPQYLPYHGLQSDSRVVLTLSSSRPNAIAVSTGAQTLIFDLSIQGLRCSIQGIGRTATAASWSELNANVLATGTIDGSLCLWDIRAPERPLRRLRAARGPCESIAFSPGNKHLIACISERVISIWDLRHRSLHPLYTVQGHESRLRSFAWHVGTSERLFVATDDGSLSTYDIVQSMQDAETTSTSGSSSDEDRNPMSTRRHRDNLTPTWTAKLDSPVKGIRFLSDDTFYALAWHGYTAFMYKIQHDGSGVSQLYSHDFENKVDAIQIVFHTAIEVLQSVGPGGAHTSDLPVSVLDHLCGRDGSPTAEIMKNLSRADVTGDEHNIADSSKNPNSATMKPLSILSQRRVTPGFPKTSNQIQQQRKSQTPRSKRETNLTHRSNERTTPPTNPSMTSSLELPKESGNNSTPSMPFLSPSIPSQRSPNGIPPLEDSTLSLPPLVVPPYEASFPSIVATAMEARDSDDSDDDTFVEALEGSATLLPGGINVPLPKACGALFGNNGQLLTFFPPKPRPGSAHGPAGLSTEQTNIGRRGQATRISRLFPSFGSFRPVKQLLEEGSDSDSFGSSDGLTDNIEHWPQFAIQHSSFKSQQSWPSKPSPTKAGYEVQSGQAKIVVSVYQVDDVSALCTAQQGLAEQYRLLRSGSESGADVCRHNAEIAEETGVVDTAHVWNLISLLLDDKVPLELLTGEQSDDSVLVVARRAKTLTRSDSGVDLCEDAGDARSYGKLRWADNPLGAAWLVRRVLAWAEQRSDIQLLACICAVLTDTQDRFERGHDSREASFFTGTPAFSLEYLLDSSTQARQPRNRLQPIPVLRTNSFVNSTSVFDSPRKLHRNSNTSSRNASQPTTPYLESTSSTPPFWSQSLSRQSTHLSTSGSMSPEHHRSSFSAAAKYYALTITDKFASYGTSPPTKKTESSPNANNELSSSLPSGSWGKSVSFAMSSTTADTTRGSLLNRSYDAPANDDVYDSDRTVEDGLEYQARDASGAVSMINMNETMFSDDFSGSVKTSLIPQDLEAKCQAWCEYYAEQLRSWNLQMQAAELEKIVGISGSAQKSHSHGVVLTQNENFNTAAKTNSDDRTCAICFSVVRLMETVCVSCQHASHLSCLGEYIAELSDDADFECPTSCGCLCSELVFTVKEVQQSSPQSKPSFKKRPSFTDPTRWRARMEGESW